MEARAIVATATTTSLGSTSTTGFLISPYRATADTREFFPFFLFFLEALIDGVISCLGLAVQVFFCKSTVWHFSTLILILFRLLKHSFSYISSYYTIAV